MWHPAKAEDRIQRQNWTMQSQAQAGGWFEGKLKDQMADEGLEVGPEGNLEEKQPAKVGRWSEGRTKGRNLRGSWELIAGNAEG